VVAALDGAPAEEAVRRVARTMGDLLGVPVRTVHVEPGPGLRGEARRSALARVARGEAEEMVGRPETVLTALAMAPGAVLTVIGARQRSPRPGARRAAGTALAVARRINRPLLMVPPGLRDWCGPTRVLSALDGTGSTALAAAAALSRITRPDTAVTSLHIADGPGRPGAWTVVDGADGWNGAPHGNGPSGDPAGHRHPAETRPIGRYVLRRALETGSDLVVLVWSRQTRGPYGAAVLDVIGASPVPVFLVPVTIARAEV